MINFFLSGKFLVEVRTSYDEAIARLNKVKNLPDAKAIIMSYTDEGDDNEVVKQLLDLVKRKLPSDG